MESACAFATAVIRFVAPGPGAPDRTTPGRPTATCVRFDWVGGAWALIYLFIVWTVFMGAAVRLTRRVIGDAPSRGSSDPVTTPVAPT